MKDNNDVVFINLDKPRELKLTHSVLKRFAAKKDVSVDDIDTVLTGYTGMVDLIYEMLLRQDPDLTVEKYEELLDCVTIKEIMDAGRAAVEASFGTKGGDQEGNPPEQTG